MLTHLQNRGGALDFADTKTLLAERDGEWDASEVPQIYFNRVKKAIQGLTRAGINSDLNERRDMALYYLKASGEFDAAVREWEQRPAGSKTWQNIKTFISSEYVEESETTVRLLRHTGQSSNHIQCQQNDPSSPQRCRILQ